MAYVPCIITGFLSLLLSDVMQIRRKKYLAAGALYFGYIAVCLSVFGLLTRSGVSVPPGFLRDLLTVAGCGATLLLIYTTTLEIPLLARLGKSDTTDFPDTGNRRAVTGGTYGIVRHPGFLWMLAATIALAALFNNRNVIIALFTVNLCNFILVALEDTVLFPRIFVNYNAYKQQVPFLVPRRSRDRTHSCH